MHSHSILADLSAETFLTDFWQKQPICIKSALRDYVSPISPDELAGLSLAAEIESRLVQGNTAQGWTLSHGPFAEHTFADLPADNWTLLVQAVDLWFPEIKSLQDRFDFLPRWRFDDVMVSFATEGGSVGPHFDNYDVFLLQVMGQREWQIGQVCDATTELDLRSGLRLLNDFQCQDVHTLDPGDMLYLPPGVAHWGVALNDCLTFSIGFRTPTLGEMMDDLATDLIADSETFLRDPPLVPSTAPDELPDAYLTQLQEFIAHLARDKQRLGEWYARYMSRPKYPDLVDQTNERRVVRVGDQEYVNGERQKATE